MEAQDVVAALAALAHDRRLAAFRMLVQAGPDGIPAGQLASALEIPAPTLTFHLNQLTQVGLATTRRVSRFVYYAADYQRMQALLDYLMENCCGGACGPAVAASSPAADRALIQIGTKTP